MARDILWTYYGGRPHSPLPGRAVLDRTELPSDRSELLVLSYQLRLQILPDRLEPDRLGS